MPIGRGPGGRSPGIDGGPCMHSHVRGRIDHTQPRCVGDHVVPLARSLKLKQRRNMSVAPWLLDTSSPERWLGPTSRSSSRVRSRGGAGSARAVGTEIGRLQALNGEYAERLSESESRANARVERRRWRSSSARVVTAPARGAGHRQRGAGPSRGLRLGHRPKDDTYAKNKTTEADSYHTKVTHEADAEAARTCREGVTRASGVRLDVRPEADRLIAETMAHRAQVLKDLAERPRPRARPAPGAAGRSRRARRCHRSRLRDGVRSHGQPAGDRHHPDLLRVARPEHRGSGGGAGGRRLGGGVRERRPAKTRRTRVTAGARQRRTRPAPARPPPRTLRTLRPSAKESPAAASVADAPADPITAEVPVVSPVHDNGTAAPTPV